MRGERALCCLDGLVRHALFEFESNWPPALTGIALEAIDLIVNWMGPAAGVVPSSLGARLGSGSAAVATVARFAQGASRVSPRRERHFSLSRQSKVSQINVPQERRPDWLRPRRAEGWCVARLCSRSTKNPLLRCFSQRPQRRQPMSAARLLAGVAAGFEFAARRRAPFVDGAGSAFSHLAGQGGAAGRAVVGAAHAAQLVGDRGCQTIGHTATAALQLLQGKVDAQAGAASATGQAGVGHIWDEKRWGSGAAGHTAGGQRTKKRPKPLRCFVLCCIAKSAFLVFSAFCKQP